MTHSTPSARPNATTVREWQLSQLARRVAHARSASAQQMTERDFTIRQFGVAHPRAIEVSQRLARSRRAHDDLANQYNRSLSEYGRSKAHDRVNATFHDASS